MTNDSCSISCDRCVGLVHQPYQVCSHPSQNEAAFGIDMVNRTQRLITLLFLYNDTLIVVKLQPLFQRVIIWI